MADDPCPHCEHQPAPTTDGWPTTLRGWALTTAALILGAALITTLATIAHGAPV